MIESCSKTSKSDTVKQEDSSSESSFKEVHDSFSDDYKIVIAEENDAEELKKAEPQLPPSCASTSRDGINTKRSMNYSQVDLNAYRLNPSAYQRV